MPSKISPQASKVLDRIDINELSNLALDLARIPSPRGFERQIGDFLLEWMAKNGFECSKQEVAEGRNNIIGILKGSEGHPKLVFNSHMDVGHGLPEDYWIYGDDRKKIAAEGTERGNLLVGRGVINDKGPMAAFLVATKAIKQSGINLRGDIVMTCVVGEIGQTPIDEFQGDRYEGKGFGTRYFVSHGGVVDYALVAEGTNFAITRAEAGDVWFKVTILGKGGIYTPFIERPFDFENNPNAIFKAAKVVQRIEEWANDYEKEHRLTFEDGTIIPKVNVGAIRGGLPVRPTQVPGVCSIYIDVRLSPMADAENVRKELEKVVSSCDVKFTIEAYLYRKGHIGKNVDRLFDAVRLAHRNVFESFPKKCAPPYTSMWRDLNVFNESGIPSVTYGPPSFTYQELTGEAVPSMKKEDLLAAAKVYALAALELCA
ncbi:MAG: M20/M25/M40 family metallo-hydrolase [Thaumarchaeota archaeon]|nr:M20/M25/M40 family metallo-hydrolase [Nitrososphaerota archaeon]